MNCNHCKSLLSESAAWMFGRLFGPFYCINCGHTFENGDPVIAPKPHKPVDVRLKSEVEG